MPANSYTEWTEDDIHTLDVMYRNDIPLDQIARALQRTPRAIEHALKNLLVQEVLHTTTQQVATKYNMHVEDLCAELAPEKYHLTKHSDHLCASVLYFIAGAVGLAVLATYL